MIMMRFPFENPFWKDVFREIKTTRNRFISLVVMSLMGAFVVVGIHATAIHMRDAADAEYRRVRLYDLQLRHPGGFTRDDINAIWDIDGVERVQPTNIVDLYIYARDTRRVVRTYSDFLIKPINAPTLVEGHWPAAPNEIVVERRLLREGGLSIGDEVNLSLGDMERFFSIFEYDTFIITGVVTSPLYITYSRGNTNLSGGSVRFIAYMYFAANLSPVYSDVFLIMEGSRDLHQVSEAYNAAANQWRSHMEDALDERNIPAFVFTRQHGLAFESYFQDTQRLQAVGYVFPLVFFLVAVLVSLTTMTRMVEEQRGQIGVYKALGYTSGAIFLKYFLYAFISGLVGGVLGAALGSQVIPRIVFDAYGHLYTMPPSNHAIPWGITAIAVFAAIISVTAAVMFTCFWVVREEAANLMRPKAPPPGKRVLIEKIPAVWRRLGFISKVTSRNIFRYKRRFFMTLAGVAGCTALLVTAFGLGDSINSVPRLQFEDIILYDAHVHTRELSYHEQAELLQMAQGTGSKPSDTLFIRTITADAHTVSGGFSATIIVPEDMSRLPDFINLIQPSFGFHPFASANPAHIPPPTAYDGVLVTEKLAREMGISIGDEFAITLGGGWSYTLQTAGIVENYLLHYIYMPPEIYAAIFDRAPRPNGLFINDTGGFDADLLRQHPSVLGIINTAFLRENLRDQTDALGIVTIVLMVSACILALVVLFNLTEINILERMRELATIKVLGFSDIETAMYLYRENIIVTLMGIALGLVAGVFLNGFILTTVEIDMLKFPHVIFPVSFALAAGISILFAFVVNLLTYRKLVVIDMVASLKSVE